MMGLTANQQRAVETRDKPLFIQAGAGTGKTFTLTKRLGYGLSAESGPMIDDVDNLLTITFTNKAAGELLGRVRAELRDRGLEDAALRVDAAWISTIHSMCRNVLKLNAFEAGLDAGADLLSEEESATLLGAAIDGLFKEMAEDDRLKLLIEAFGPDGACSLLKDLAQNKLQLSPHGAPGFEYGPEPAVPDASLVLKVSGVARDVLNELQGMGAPDTATCQKSFDKVVQTAELTERFVHEDMPEQLSWADVSDVLHACPLTKGGNIKKQFKSQFAYMYETLVYAQAQAASALAYARLEAAVELASCVIERHRELKRRLGSVDMGDLLIETYHLLDKHPEIARTYRERFSSIMVDEFQDTDLLQVEIIKRMCDERLSALATVGDAQQSIYGFRGADLEVYRGVRELMRRCGSEEVALDTNYRSHPDILAFVEDIFSDPAFFGRDFLKVKPGPNNAVARCWHADGSPRVSVLYSAGSKNPEGRGRTGVDALRRSDAQLVAEAFEEYARQGASYGDMAVLMRSTKHAQIYLDAMRMRGIPCMVSGGSTYFTLDEVKTLTAFMRVLENRDDDEALFSVLGSHFFDVSDTDLLALSVVNKQHLRVGADEARVKQSLFDALRFVCTKDAERLARCGVSEPSALLKKAYETVSTALKDAETTPLSLVVLDAVKRSGWQATLQGQGPAGTAVQANIWRFADLLDDFEASNGHDVVGAAEHFRTMCELAEEGTGARGKPGAMVAFGNDAVQVMTIHASKGLEFPIVAVAEFESSARSSTGRANALTENGKTYLSLPMKAEREVWEYLSEQEVAADEFAAAKTQLAYALHARELGERRAAEEEQRLFYVALTRARDTLLVVAHGSAYASTGKLDNGLFNDVASVLFPDGLPSDGSVVKMVGGELVKVGVREVPYAPDDAQPATQDDRAESELAVIEHVMLDYGVQARPAHRVRRKCKLKSYSSLHEEEAAEATGGVAALRNREEDAETASPIGSAFHLVAQWMAQQAEISEAGLQERVLAVAKRYDLDEEGLARLGSAVQSWAASTRYAQARSFDDVHAEYPFCVTVGTVALEGFIDLLCVSDGKEDALVIDYKTGTSGSPEELAQRYRLQAVCYAFAVLDLGFAQHVDVVFVRPEVGMQEVAYSFDDKSKEDLIAEICA